MNLFKKLPFYGSALVFILLLNISCEEKEQQNTKKQVQEFPVLTIETKDVTTQKNIKLLLKV